MSTPRASDDVGQHFDDRFQILSVLGVSATSRIYLALDTVIDRRVVIRLLRTDLAGDNEALAVFRTRMRRESNLTFDNILPVYYSGEAPSPQDPSISVPYLVTQFMGGGSLRTMLDANGPLSLPQIVQIGIYAANGLAAAHSNGSFHLDIRPEHFLFADDAERSLRIKDFGLARALLESSLTERDTPGSTPANYSAPEVLSGGSSDGRSDVYSLALILVEAFTGSVPLTGGSALETSSIRNAQDLKLTIDFGPLQSVLEQAGRSDIEDRPDAFTFARQLQDSAAALPSPVRLPIVPTLGVGSETLQFDRPVISTTMARPASAPSKSSDSLLESSVAAPVESSVAAPDHASGPSPEPRIPASDPEPYFGLVMDPDEQEAILAKSRPQSFGRVAPFGKESVGSAVPEPAPLVTDIGSDDDIAISSDDEPASSIAENNEPSEGERPRRGRRVVLAGTIFAVLALAAGGTAYWWFQIRVVTHAVPSMIGKSSDEASRALKRLNFVVDASREERRDGTKPGEIIEQSPKARTILGEGETVRLTVSIGQTLRTVPELTGLSRDDALAAIAKSDLIVGSETTAHDEQAPAGTVISASVAADGDRPDTNGQVPRDTAMDLVVSDGPAPRVVPSGLIGASAEQARAALTEVQLQVTILEAYDEKAPKGQIIKSSAESGVELPRDSKVTLTMSKGPAPVPVPNTIGMTGSAGAARLEAAGFIVEGIEGSPTGIILQTDPTPGSSRLRGTTVRIFTQTR